MQVLVVSLVVLMSCVWTGHSKTAPCPPCPKNEGPCHTMFMVGDPDGCSCSVCLTLCYERENFCGTGKSCVPKPVFYNGTEVGQTASCVKFEKCPNHDCPDSCLKTGFFIDFNKCKTCLCNDPCVEKCPSGQCSFWSINPGTDPNYDCEDS